MKAPGPKRKGQHRWKGELAKSFWAGVSLTNEVTNENLDDCLRQAIHEKHIEKLALLMEHYKIADKADYRSLALALAVDHVPGFQVVPARKVFRLRHGNYGAVIGYKRGRMRVRTPDRLDRLKTVVEETKKKHRLKSDREALEIIAAQKEEWRRPTKSGLQQWIKTLRNQLAAARRRRPEN
jgi:hypothetical protein